jgi:hypothetical protein
LRRIGVFDEACCATQGRAAAKARADCVMNWRRVGIRLLVDTWYDMDISLYKRLFRGICHWTMFPIFLTSMHCAS